MKTGPVVYQIEHSTIYDYAQPVGRARHLLHLSPRQVAWQNWRSCQLLIDPVPEERTEALDVWNNPATWLSYEGWHDRLSVHWQARCAVEERPWHYCLRIPAPDSSWEQVSAALDFGQQPELDQLCFRYQSTHVQIKQQLVEFSRDFFKGGCSVLQGAIALTMYIQQHFTYRPNTTDVHTSVMNIWRSRTGVCQDFAHLMIACLRSLGLPARYVAGYLCTEAPTDTERLRGVDATHAWVAVWTPEWGWVEMDPTNGCLADQRHIVVGWGRDFADVSPLRGVIQGGGVPQLQVAVTVNPVH